MKRITFVIAVLLLSTMGFAQKASLADQKMCAEQAKNFFDNTESAKFSNVLKSGYVSHFNKAAQTCYVGVTRTILLPDHSDHTKDSRYVYVGVFNAFERTEMAIYVDNRDPLDTASVLNCQVSPPDHDVIKCEAHGATEQIPEFVHLMQQWFGIDITIR